MNEATTYTEVKRAVMAAMETGNQAAAETLLNEFNEFTPDGAEHLNADVMSSYGVNLLGM